MSWPCAQVYMMRPVAIDVGVICVPYQGILTPGAAARREVASVARPCRHRPSSSAGGASQDSAARSTKCSGFGQHGGELGDERVGIGRRQVRDVVGPGQVCDLVCHGPAGGGRVARPVGVRAAGEVGVEVRRLRFEVGEQLGDGRHRCPIPGWWHGRAVPGAVPRLESTVCRRVGWVRQARAGRRPRPARAGTTRRGRRLAAHAARPPGPSPGGYRWRCPTTRRPRACRCRSGSGRGWLPGR